MFSALRTSLGKRPQQRLLLIGTRMPARPGSWWLDLVDGGSGPRTVVHERKAPAGAPWDLWNTIRAANPMVMPNPDMRRTILAERDEARRNPTLRADFEGYRLNRTVGGGEDMLVSPASWKAVEAREVPERVGRPLVGLDLGGSRAWSAAWCLWLNGRSECYAVCPGIPDLATRERQDSVERGLYQALARGGALVVDEGVQRSRPRVLIEHLLERGIVPRVMIHDRYLAPDLRDAVAGRWPLYERGAGGKAASEATSDIAAFQKLTLDGPLSIVPESRALARVSLREARVVHSRQGTAYVEKRRNRRSRDDVAISGCHAAGALVRELRGGPRRPAVRSLGIIG